MNLNTLMLHLDSVALRLFGAPSDEHRVHFEHHLNRVHPDDISALRLILQETIETHRDFDFDYRIVRPGSGRVVWLNSRGSVEIGADGHPIAYGTSYDVTRRKANEENSELVAGEMSHRVKNLLTVVQSLFRMSCASAADKDALRDNFLARLDALKALNDLLQRPSNPPSTGELALQVLAPVMDDERMHLELDGFALNDGAAQTLSLCLNELMTNAIKYGALSMDGGEVRLHLGLDLERDENDLLLEWHEVCPQAIVQPEKTNGFGFVVLQNMTRTTFSGKPEFSWREDGLTFRCTWPAEQMG
ncbi:sensor histidine kinase [Palleronia caenipelagi]|nr:HWE histidine kinase domain-containing protein [Palleronia caenipelagi]